MNEKDKVEYSVYQALALILTMALIIIGICMGIMKFMTESDGSSILTSAETSKLNAVQPSKSEINVKDNISVSTEGYVKKNTDSANNTYDGGFVYENNSASGTDYYTDSYGTGYDDTYDNIYDDSSNGSYGDGTGDSYSDSYDSTDGSYGDYTY